MISRIIKIALSTACVALMVKLFYEGYIAWGLTMLLPTAIFVFSIFRNEHLLLAFNHLRKQDMEKAQKSVNRIKKPDSLPRRQRAYYYYLSALIGSQSSSLGKSEALFKKALSTGLRLAQDQAVAKMNLAVISMSKRRKREAITLLNEAKKLDKKGILAGQIKDIRKNMDKVSSAQMHASSYSKKGQRAR